MRRGEKSRSQTKELAAQGLHIRAQGLRIRANGIVNSADYLQFRLFSHLRYLSKLPGLGVATRSTVAFQLLTVDRCQWCGAVDSCQSAQSGRVIALERWFDRAAIGRASSAAVHQSRPLCSPAVGRSLARAARQRA